MRRFRRFGYHGSDKGEVDFVLPTQWCVEVKWSPVATHLSKAYFNLQVPQKIVWTYDSFLVDWPRPTQVTGAGG